jgi:hypothetical protein
VEDVTTLENIKFSRCIDLNLNNVWQHNEKEKNPIYGDSLVAK